MEISRIEVGDAIKVTIEGNLDTNTSPDAQTYLDELVDSGQKKILISFESTNFVSSAGLRVILATAKLLSKNGGDLRLCNLSPTVRDVFEISGFTTILNVFDSEQEAIDSF
jgi:anti-anti-sigma factor